MVGERKKKITRHTTIGFRNNGNFLASFGRFITLEIPRINHENEVYLRGSVVRNGLPLCVRRVELVLCVFLRVELLNTRQSDLRDTAENYAQPARIFQRV